jgi:hypothetical protein
LSNNTFIEKAVQEYEDVLENNGAGARIIAAFTAVKYALEFLDLIT